MEEKTMFEKMRESGSKLPDIVEFLKFNGWKTHNHHDNWIKDGIEGEYDTHQAYEIAKNNAESLKYAVELLCNALREDTSDWSLYFDWKTKIAQEFVDEFHRYFEGDKYKDFGHDAEWVANLSDEYLLKVSNEAAKNFLNLLISK